MTTSIHITALDGIVNVNSLFTLAVFLGLAWSPADPNNTLTDPADPTTCPPTRRISEDLITFHVYSFASFLFSSIVALPVKQALRIAGDGGTTTTSFHLNHNHQVPADLIARVNKSLVRVGMLVSGVGSFSGVVFLMLALVNLVQFKVGSLACGNGHAIADVVPLLILVPTALLIYASVVVYAFRAPITGSHPILKIPKIFLWVVVIGG